MNRLIRRLFLGYALLFLAITSFANNDRLIVKFKPTLEQSKLLKTGRITDKELRGALMQPLSNSQLNQLSKLAGFKLKELHAIGTGAHVLILDKSLDETQLQQVIDNIRKDKTLNIEYIEEDRKVKRVATVANPNIQWDMFTQGAFTPQPAWVGDNFVNAWDKITGNPGANIIVAVIDTGYTPHPNILSKLQQINPGNYGYQFISDCRVAGSCPVTQTNNITLAPQINALDQGDYLTFAEANNPSNPDFFGCEWGNSSWHGTHVAGTIVADGYLAGSPTNQIAGGAWGAKVVPIRVLGKCGGYDSDVVDGILWSVNERFGINNPNPAHVLNLSLGGVGVCLPTYQDAINIVNSKNAIFVAAAGNASSNVANFSPANCQNVISVSAKGSTDGLAYYSNFGNTTISASGGDVTVSPCPGGLCGVYSTIWASTQQYNPASGGTFAYYQGTSMAAPHVSAAVADIIGFLQQRGDSYNLIRITGILQSSASQLSNNCIFPGGCAINGLALNVANALDYIVNGFFLTPSQQSVTFTALNSLQTITFTNNSTAVTISNITVSQGFSLASISSLAACTAGLDLNPGNSCTIEVMVNNLSVSTSGVLRIFGTNNVVLATVNLNYQVPVQPSAGKGGGGGGGGCSTINSGDDLGLLLILLSITLYAYYRRIRKS